MGTVMAGHSHGYSYGWDIAMGTVMGWDIAMGTVMAGHSHGYSYGWT